MAKKPMLSGCVCCFCDGDVDPDGLDPASLYYAARWLKSNPDQDEDDAVEQQFFCHTACFVARLDKNFPLREELDPFAVKKPPKRRAPR